MTVYSLCLVFILTLCGWHLIVLFLGFAISGIDYILHNLYFNSSLKGISPPQWQHFICSRIFFCQLLTLYQENWISPPQWQDFICSGIWFCQLLNLQQENRISPPQCRASSVQESTSFIISFSTKKIEFLHPSGRASFEIL